MGKSSNTSTPPRRNSRYMGLMAVLGVGAFFPASTLLILAGLFPTYIAWLTDRSRGKLTSITVASLNLAAIMPLLLQLLDKGNKLPQAISLLVSPFSWILLLAGAGVGWVLAQIFPMMVVVIITARDKSKLDRIKARQALLVEQWGSAITEIPTPRGRSN